MIRMFSFAARKLLLNHFPKLALWYNESDIVFFGVAAK